MGLPGYDDDAEVMPAHQPPEDPQPSIMRQLLTFEEVERLEIAPGRWYLPGTPP